MASKLKGNLYIGTSGIVVPGSKQTFPEAFKNTSRLHYYATLFNTLEVNSSFYKVPFPTTFEKWALDVPNEFQFTVKLWRDITHAKNLDFDLENIDHFMHALSLMTHKKGCLLIQFPASINFTYIKKVEEILQRVHKLDPDQTWRRALEFRHSSWYNEETYYLLDKYQASIVLHDMPKSHTEMLNKKADFVYLRFHGIKGDYKDSYSDDLLKKYAGKILGWLEQGKNVYAYFNNTMGDAFSNARTLRQYIQED